MPDQTTDSPPAGSAEAAHRQALHRQPVVQSLRDTLASLDAAYEQERENLDRVLTDPDLKKVMQEKLRERHRRQRDPYLQQLTILQQRSSRSTAPGDHSTASALPPNEGRHALTEPFPPLHRQYA